MSEGTEARKWITIVAAGVLAPSLLVFGCMLYLPPESAVRTAGGLLQLLGTFLLAAGISQVRQRWTGHPGFLQLLLNVISKAWRRLRMFFGYQPPSQTIRLPAASIGLGTGRARVMIGLNRNGTVEEQIGHLQQFAEQLQKQVQENRKALKKERKERIEAGAEARRERLTADAEIKDEVRELATGGLQLETAAIVYLLVGTCLLIWP